MTHDIGDYAYWEEVRETLRVTLALHDGMRRDDLLLSMLGMLLTDVRRLQRDMARMNAKGGNDATTDHDAATWP